MAGEILFEDAPGHVCYAVLRDAVGRAYNTSSLAFESYLTANYANYKITCTEQGTASGVYAGTMPSVSAGAYAIVGKEQAGGSPSESDLSVADGDLDWGGSAAVAFPANFSSLAVSAAGGVTLADAVAHGGTPGSSTATLALKQFRIANSTGVGFWIASSNVNSEGILVQATAGNAPAIRGVGTGTAAGMRLQGGSTGPGLLTQGGASAGAGWRAESSGGGDPAVHFVCGGGGGAGFLIIADTGGHDIQLGGDGLIGGDILDVAGKSLALTLKYIGAAVAGKVSGAGTGTETFADFTGTTAQVVTVDVNGNRTNVVYS